MQAHSVKLYSSMPEPSCNPSGRFSRVDERWFHLDLDLLKDVYHPFCFPSPFPVQWTPYHHRRSHQIVYADTCRAQSMRAFGHTTLPYTNRGSLLPRCRLLPGCLLLQTVSQGGVRCISGGDFQFTATFFPRCSGVSLEANIIQSRHFTSNSFALARTSKGAIP